MGPISTVKSLFSHQDSASQGWKETKLVKQWQLTKLPGQKDKEGGGLRIRMSSVG